VWSSRGAQDGSNANGVDVAVGGASAALGRLPGTGCGFGVLIVDSGVRVSGEMRRQKMSISLDEFDPAGVRVSLRHGLADETRLCNVQVCAPRVLLTRLLRWRKT
jgi:hypothetical protein